MNLDTLVTNEFLAARFTEQDALLDRLFAELNTKLDNNHRTMVWTQAVILTAVLFPYLERLLAIG